MITDRIKAIFQFIDFLHSNIEKFKQFEGVVSELNSIAEERSRLSPGKNVADKLQYDALQVEWKQKSDEISESITKPIFAKALELNICDSNYIMTLWNWNISDISELIKNFSKEDIQEIFTHKAKYFEFRMSTNSTYLNGIFFDNLDQILNVLFDFFKEGGSAGQQARLESEKHGQQPQLKINDEEIEIEDDDEFLRLSLYLKEKKKRDARAVL